MEILETEKELLESIDNDSIELSEKTMGVVNQLEDNLLAYSITGLYTNEKESKYLPKRVFKKEPPVLKISSNDGREVDFLLTKEFTKMLSQSLEEVNKAYLGYRYSVDDEMSFKNKITNIPNWFSKNPYQVIFTIGTILIFIYLVMKGLLR